METLKILLTIYTLCYILSIPGLWMIFQKCDYRGWYALIPILNYVILLRVVGWSGWLIFTLFIPILALILDILVSYRLSKSFGTNLLFAVGLWLWITKPIFFSILGFGNYNFIGTDGVV